jgi:16S rRNA (uracil1498-N3)-methyltransferase
MADVDRSVLRSTSAHVLVDPELLSDTGELALDDDTDHHLRRVLRLRDGEAVSVTDGGGRWCLATARISAHQCRLEVTSAIQVDAPPATTITIGAAIPKGDRLDWMVQKAAELGVDRLVLLHAAQSVVRWKPERVEHQMARLQRIADEALRQSRRVFRLRIDPPAAAVDVLADFVLAEPGGRRLAVGDTAVAVGPEGGWDAAELAAGRDRVDLGATILRTETAAVAVSTLCVAFNR